VVDLLQGVAVKLFRVAFLVMSAVPVFGSACGTKEDHPPSYGSMTMPPAPLPGVGGPRADGSTVDAAGDSGTCVTIAITGSAVSQTYQPDPAQVPVGGIITQGTYVLTGANIFTGLGGVTGQTRRRTAARWGSKPRAARSRPRAPS
jgi:hypothetical protein